MSVQMRDARDSNNLVEFNKEKLELIKSMFAKDATDMEFDLFIAMATRLQLDPVIKQIYFVKFGGKMSIIVGIDGYRLIADRTGKYMPGRESTFVYDKEGRLFSATSYVKKLGPDGQWHEFGATAIRSEYDTGINQWKKGPHYMLAKCAEGLALRKGWPAEFSGTHTEEEMDKAVNDTKPQLAQAEVSINDDNMLKEFKAKFAPLELPYANFPDFLEEASKKSKGKKTTTEAAKYAVDNPEWFEKTYKKWSSDKAPAFDIKDLPRSMDELPLDESTAP